MLAASIVFYGVLMGLNNLEGNIILNGVIIGSADIVAGASIGVLANYFGRVGYLCFGWAFLSLSFFTYFFA